MKYLKNAIFLLAILIGITSCKNEKKSEINLVKETEIISNADLGLKYAMTTKAQLGKNLMGTIQSKGTEEAVTFCNVKAFPLTDSMAVVHKAIIKRVSDKPRNLNNAASLKEIDHIKKFKREIASGQKMVPIIEPLDNDSIQFYYPIITNKMCLQCHGEPNKDIKPAVFEKLTALYPEDKAVGYSEDQVRGIWSITMKNQEN